ncbi:isochorismate synthase MenF [Dechloromonas sp. H13]|uniref:isochorismate synthase n=1 Tax=Dechloromonas sp. H13 TaxID=2570193 RepID=UPI001290CF03|nr:isochorismate synthase [Dechloromonas sp. H13]
MIAALRRHLADPTLPARLRTLAADVPAATPLSITIDLGPTAADWLAALPAAGPFWYQARPAAGLYRLGIGHAFQIASAGPQRFAALDNAFAGLARHWRHDGAPLAFCGFAFDEHNIAPLPNILLAIPAVLLESRAGRSRAILSTPAGRIAGAPDLWRQLLARPAPRPPLRLAPAADPTLADRAWIARVNAALRAIAGGEVDKIVLARHRQLAGDGLAAAGRVLAALGAQQPDSLVYAHGTGTAIFLGATPERLIRLAGHQLAADALAGTAWSGSLDLDAPKNRREQSLVVRAILAALAGHCSLPPQAGPVSVRQAGAIAHLHSRIAGTAASGVTLFDLVRALHPTPAVGGFPGPAALDWLARHGERRSAWYSGGFGSLAPNGDGEFAVALRSALLTADGIELHAGAGIVAGSDPHQELAETEAKFGTLLAALAGHRDDLRSAHA